MKRNYGGLIFKGGYSYYTEYRCHKLNLKFKWRRHSFVLSTYWHSSALCLEASLQKKNLPLKSCTPTMAKMRRNSM